MTQDAGFPAPTDLIEKLTAATEGDTTNDQIVDIVNAFLNSRVVFPSADPAGEDRPGRPPLHGGWRCVGACHLLVSRMSPDAGG